MKLAIVGSGAIGSLFTYYWQALNPTILLRSLLAPKKELRLLDGQFDKYMSDGLVPKQHIFQPKNTAIDILVIPIKSYQVASLIDNIQDWLLPSTVLLLIQNGMGGAKRLADAFPDNPIVVGTTTDAVFAATETCYQVTAYGKLDIGVYSAGEQHTDAFMQWVHKLAKVHPNAQVYNNVDELLFKKLAINAAINPLTALLNIKNGELVQYQAELDHIYQDLTAIYTALALPFTYSHIKQAVEEVIDSTANNYSSMHQDLHFGRRTEVDGVLGFLLEQAQQCKISAPYIEGLFARIKKLETA